MSLTIEHFNNSGKIIARAVGPAQAYRLLKEYGGQRFFISQKPRANHVTSKKLGLAVHKALAKIWPEQRFELPVVNNIEKRLRNEAIIDDAQRMSMRELVKKYQLTRYQLQKVIGGRRSEIDADSENPCQKQLSFF